MTTLLNNWYERWRINQAKKQANKLDKLYNKKHWVLKMPGNKLVIVNRENIKQSNRQLSKGERADILKLMENAIYVTR
jgi:hypothetical protein